MGKAAAGILGDRLEAGVVVTKYGHVKGRFPGRSALRRDIRCRTKILIWPQELTLELVERTTAQDEVIFLLSGGGSALFEKPLVSGEELADITGQLLACGADIVEMNTIRKRLSAVKGGRFAQACKPARVFSIVLSDILGDPLDMIASGPAYPDSSTCGEALAIAEKYGLQMSGEAWAPLGEETPKQLDGVETQVTGSVSDLCRAAAAPVRSWDTSL